MSRRAAAAIPAELAERLLAAAVAAALGGDAALLRAFLVHLLPPPRREPLVRLALPPLREAADAVAASAALAAAVAAGRISPGEAASASRLLDVFVRAVDGADHEARLRAIEEKLARDR